MINAAFPVEETPAWQSMECADPRLQNNAIHDGAEGGIFIFGGSRGKYENNDIYSNNLHGVHIAEGSDPEFRSNRIYDGKGCGVLVIDGGQGTFWTMR